jgi:hypothetical protein
MKRESDHFHLYFGENLDGLSFKISWTNVRSKRLPWHLMLRGQQKYSHRRESWDPSPPQCRQEICLVLTYRTELSRIQRLFYLLIQNGIACYSIFPVTGKSSWSFAIEARRMPVNGLRNSQSERLVIGLDDEVFHQLKGTVNELGRNENANLFLTINSDRHNWFIGSANKCSHRFILPLFHVSLLFLWTWTC